jgi:hypothetical protein
MEAICSSETSVDFNGLHGVISQKIELLITTALRTSNPTEGLSTNLLVMKGFFAPFLLRAPNEDNG